ncbi:Methylated-DNA--protein-cysteine methyltransferase [Thioalkalivibrio nitratireducens DSM 14787]|uniref:Methylated-DNA--protein-cysteine methyltransferase n=1 Tax=Thioalkalivibrio nitratireducens (strain DSM 14787 / UNIQEM 213 / ALEN2) TaxID=1255043 RepID=L0E345_THIND|nr:MGMT family protein [Thioalkalivibrio nitratireducens]AGA35056.1 Methylated-DNA--protein-cysteine methyltransferase [Thioalkalivibrio nitratireducens DSM 14787]
MSGIPSSASGDVDLRRCFLPRAALEFMFASSASHGLLTADWVARTSDPDGSDAAHLPPGFRGALERARRWPVPAAPVVPPFDPADYLRDPVHWRAPAGLPPGTPHARKVWQALCRIPVGEVRTYGEIAHEIGSSPRAVGQACRINPWPVFIPCHRVVPATGWRSGAGAYAGQREGAFADIKGWLLKHEQADLGSAVSGR